MKWTSLNDLREKYLSFFESKGHLRLPSFPLVPQGDKSLLLIFNRQQIYCYPKRCLSVEQEGAVRDYLTNRLSGE